MSTTQVIDFGDFPIVPPGAELPPPPPVSFLQYLRFIAHNPFKTQMSIEERDMQLDRTPAPVRFEWKE